MLKTGIGRLTSLNLQRVSQRAAVKRAKPQKEAKKEVKEEVKEVQDKKQDGEGKKKKFWKKKQRVE